MFCTECGCKVEDGFKFCPRCGTQVARVGQQQVQPQLQNVKSELDRIADEIVQWCPSKTEAVKTFQKRTGVDLKTAHDMMIPRYKNREKENFLSNRCPKCGSDNIEFTKEPDRSTTVSYFEGVYSTRYTPGKTKAKCRNCGKKWKI